MVPHHSQASASPKRRADDDLEFREAVKRPKSEGEVHGNNLVGPLLGIEA